MIFPQEDIDRALRLTSDALECCSRLRRQLDPPPPEKFDDALRRLRETTPTQREEAA